MRISIRKDMLLFAIVSIVGFNASSQSKQNFCTLKIFVNDPYAQIFVDGQMIGAPPQIIPCSDNEKSIFVKSSDGQIFSRLMTSKNNFDLSNSTLNVVFHKKRTDIVVNALAVNHEETQLKPEVEATRLVSSKEQPPLAPKKLYGTYVQIFALKSIDKSKIQQGISNHYFGKVIEREVTVCPWKSATGAQELSLVLVGPFNKASAQQARNKIGGKSFIVTDPQCIGDSTTVGL